MQKEMLDRVGGKCLSLADGLLNKETATSADTLAAAKELVNIAISIEVLSLRLEEQTRFYASSSRGPLFEQIKSEN